MIFRTEFSIPPSEQKISHKDTIFLLGSCFSEAVGVKLKNSGFNALSNPFGTVYNPVSIARQLSMIMTRERINPDQFVLSQGLWVHPDFHSSMGQTTAEKAAERINAVLAHMHEKISHTGWLILTTGTALGYVWQQTGQVVANCHKLPADAFTKRYLQVDEMVSSLQQSITQIKAINPTIKIVLTVSPVRHTREGMIENTRSKARLIETAHQLANAMPDIAYFPSFELVMDDLRDYRFYEPDMIHPNGQAVDYIWQHFKHCFMDKDSQHIANQASALNQAANHKPFNPETPAFKEFCQIQLSKIATLERSCPSINLENAKNHFSSFLK